MSEYNQRMTLVVPKQYINEANNLALISGESVADINTFTSANWTDSDGNLYAVCSASIKPVVLSLYGSKLSTLELPEHALEANVEAAQAALDNSIMYDGSNTDLSKIMIAIDYDPLQFFNDIGLSAVEDLEQI